MKLILAGILLLLLGSPASAGEREQQRKARFAPLPARQVEDFVGQLSLVLQEVHCKYIDPVTLSSLTEAALVGLYTGAGESIPPSLVNDVREAERWEYFQHLDFFPTTMKCGLLISWSVEYRLHSVIRSARAELGTAPTLNGENAMLHSLRGIMKILDPYSKLESGDDYLNSLLPAARNGVGIRVVHNGGNGPLFIKSVSPGSPAQKAGLFPGDQITSLDNQEVSEMASEIAANVLNGSQGTNLNRPIPIAVSRKGRPPRKVELVPEEFLPETLLGVARNSDNSWNFGFGSSRQLGYVRLQFLDTHTSQQLQRQLNDFKTGRVQGLILDLRWCPGGSLDEAIAVADFFLSDRIIALTLARGNLTTYFSTSSQPLYGDPLVVLINEETSGGAELIAAALQDTGRAKVVGQRSRGKASIQELIPLPVHTFQLKLTKGIFLRSSRKNLHRFPQSKIRDEWGVLPEREIRASREFNSRLKEWWELQSLRPFWDQQALPLDDLSGDPVLSCGKAVLEKAITAKKS